MDEAQYESSSGLLASVARFKRVVARGRGESEQRLIGITTDLVANGNSPAALAEREAASQQLQTLLTRERQLSVETALFGGKVDPREPARLPGAPSSHSPGGAPHRPSAG